jgi:sulfane dehydrogenase subunit SoxC
MESKSSGRRKFLKNSAALMGAAAAGIRPANGRAPDTDMGNNMDMPDLEALIAYGQRSPFVKSKRISVMERMSPDEFGMTFHVLSPIQDSVGMITPSSLHYISTHRGSYVPNIDPKEHRLLIHGMVDRPLIFSVDEIKRFPFVTRPHFLECLGNRAKASHKTAQETHGLTSCSEWTGVPLSLLLKEAGVQSGAAFIVAEGAESVKGATSIPIGKAMDDCLVAYGQNGEALRPQQGFPIRLLVPGFEGMHNVKYLRRIKVVEKDYMTYNDYGHIVPDARVAALTRIIGPKSVITYPSGEQKLSGPGYYEITGLAWSGSGAIRSVEITTDGGQTWKPAELRTPSYPMAHTRFAFPWTWDGKEWVIMSRCTDELGTRQPTRAESAKFFNKPDDKDFRAPGADNTVFPWRIAADGSVHNGMA